jgi:hypothetical protein
LDLEKYLSLLRIIHLNFKTMIMKRILMFFCAAALVSALCAGCNNSGSNDAPQKSGLGEEIQGVEIKQATGTIIGSYSNGFSSLLLQVDEAFPIGGTIEPVEYKRLYTTLPEDGTFHNMIQVQCDLSVEIGKKISFSCREYQAEKDFEPLFSANGGAARMFGEPKPDVPIYVITKYEILKN